MKDAERWTRSAVRGMPTPEYEAPGGGMLRLDANTNLLGPNPVLASSSRRWVAVEANQYPSGNSDELRGALSDYLRVPAACIVVGNGSDEIIDLCGKAFLDPGSVLAHPSPSFVMYGFCGRIHLGRVTSVPLKEDWSLDVPRMLATRARLTFVASPNNPTGNAFPEADLDRLARRGAGVVVVDEAYSEFCGQDWARKATRLPNVIAMRTFSKAFGLAGLRVGYAVARKELARQLLRVKAPFNVGTISERVAVAALRNPAFMRRTVETVRRERPRLAAGLAHLGFLVFRSDANFLLAESPIPSETLAARLRAKGILIKDMGHVPELEDCVRVTVGPAEVNRRFLRALAEVL